ncbi:MAG: hypothetical protein GY859_38645 [Desulfobacterales bacterium]|nr:hypothetical protein [Desulfobacterales bacterium]
MGKKAGPRVACFVSPHGFGHAARASAVMAGLYEIDPAIHFHIFTTAPAWFFRNSLSGSFSMHPVRTDIGLVQETPLFEDVDSTLDALDAFLPFAPDLIDDLAHQVRAAGCELVLCDIAPMGVAVAREASAPSVLVENFTWDWIYAGYNHPGLDKHVRCLETLFNAADYRIQATPVCAPVKADLTTAPVSRKNRASRRETREKLGIGEDEKAALITMGGALEGFEFANAPAGCRQVRLVIPGGAESLTLRGNQVLLPHDSDFFHPDLIHACDAVVGKVGYSTLAETWQAGVPYGYIPRPHFRESAPLVAFIQKEMPGRLIDAAAFHDGTWTSRLEDLVNTPRTPRAAPNGADQAAAFIYSLL